jgi:hypothetical protein
MRLALVREYANHVDPLPVVSTIFSSTSIRIAAARRSRPCGTVLHHQVLLFTCHPHLVKQVEETVPEANIFPLG